MKNGSTIFLKSVLVIIALSVLTGLAYFPQLEGRATHLDMLRIYRDPFIIYIYIASTPFFIALYQAYKLLGRIDANKIFTTKSVSIVNAIKQCALAIIGFLIVAIAYIRIFAGDEDAAGATMIGIVTILATTVIATATAVLQKLLQNAVDMKSENDLTV